MSIDLSQASCLAGRRRGVTLVEVIMFILIISVAVVSILHLLGLAVARSGDPLVRRQSLAVAESLIQEIDAQPYAQKDPYNPNGPDDGLGPEPGESRGGGSLPFDNPNDYAGYAENGIVTPDGSAIAGLESYSASVTAVQQAMGTVPASDGLLVTVTVTGPGGEPITLTTFRARYAP
jgi:MSHA pilin protein MshD